MHSCTHWLRPRNSPPPPPCPRIWAHIREGRYWSAKIDDISLWPPGCSCRWQLFVLISDVGCRVLIVGVGCFRWFLVVGCRLCRVPVVGCRSLFSIFLSMPSSDMYIHICYESVLHSWYKCSRWLHLHHCNFLLQWKRKLITSGYLSRLKIWKQYALHALNTTVHCKDTIPKIRNKYSQKRNCAAPDPIPTFMFLWAIYLFPWSVCLFCFRKIGGPNVGILDRSQTHEHGNWNT